MRIKIFQRYQDKNNLSLGDMQDKCETTGRGLCCYEYRGLIETAFIEQIADIGDRGEIVIFEGDIWGTCPEGFTCYPEKIIQRIPVQCRINKQTGYKEFFV
jgi:hypothetical protein